MPSNPYAAPTAAVADIQAADSQMFGYAGFWRRFLAVVLDSIILTIPFLIFGAILGVWYGATGKADQIEGATSSMEGFLNLLSFVASWLYFAFMESSEQGATLGKKLLGMRVTDTAGNRISFGRASGRFFGKIVSGAILAIGYLMQPFTQKKQALHDMLASCVIVKTRE